MKLITSLAILTGACIIGAAQAFVVPTGTSPGRWVSRLNDAHIKISDWSKLEAPPFGPGSRFGPNWGVHPETLDPVNKPDTLGTLAWSLGDSTFLPPERRQDLPVGAWLDERHNIGICMSGGGERAATTALGWLRGLHHMEVLTKARYFAANSGGTWTTLPLFSKQILDKKNKNMNMNYDHQLGPYLEPKSITMAPSELGLTGKVLAKADVFNFTDDGKGRYNAWCDSIKQNYFIPVMGPKGGEDYWLEACEAYMWNNEAKDPKIADILNQYNTLPFPVYVATCSRDINKYEVFPFEMTPMYVGIPVNPSAKLGGGYSLGTAFNAATTTNTEPVPVDPQAHYAAELQGLPSPVVKLFELTGASSNFGAAFDAMTHPWVVPGFVKLAFGILDRLPKRIKKRLPINDKDALFVEPGNYRFWSPDAGGAPTPIQLVDGGLLDNLGVLALLRRQCSTLLVCNAAGSAVTANPKKWGSDFADVAALFGRQVSQLPWGFRWLGKKSFHDTINKRSQVFEASEFDVLMGEMHELQKAKNVSVVRKTMNVLANPEAGIFEPTKVDVIWLFNSEVAAFEDEFHKSAKASTEFHIDKAFPYYSTFDVNYTPGDVNKFAHLCAYQMVEGLNSVGFDINTVPK